MASPPTPISWQRWWYIDPIKGNNPAYIVPYTDWTTGGYIQFLFVCWVDVWESNLTDDARIKIVKDVDNCISEFDAEVLSEEESRPYRWNLMDK